jgi:PAS domain S-box-containing protein
MVLAAIPQRFTQWLGEAVTYDVALSRLGISHLFLALYLLLPECVTVLLLVVTGILIFQQRSDDWMVLLFSLMLVTMGVVFSPILHTLAESRPLALRLTLMLEGLGVLLSLLFFYLFPDGRYVPRFTRFLMLGWGLWALSWSLFPYAPTTPYSGSSGIGSMLMFVAYLTALSAQGYRYLAVFDVEQRKRARWIVLGVGGAFVAWWGIMLAYPVAGLVLPGAIRRLYRLFVSPALSYFPPFVIFLSIMISIFRYRLWDVDLLINRGLVYSLLTALLGGLYLVMVFLMTLVVRAFFSEANSTLVVFAATLTISLTFNPLRQRIQALIDRTLYRTNVDYRKVVQELSADLASSIDLDRLVALLTEDVPERLQVLGATLAVLSPEAECLMVYAEEGESCYLRLEDPLVAYLRQHQFPISHFKPPPDLPLAVREFLMQRDIALCIPLTVGEQLVGIYNVGAKLSGGVYSYEEIHMLHLLGQQAAVSVENARLYHQVQRYNLRLEDQVQARTHELAEAYRTLAEQHAQLDIILHNIADALVVTGPAGEIVLVNAAFEAWMGRKAETFVGRCLGDALPSEHLQAAVSAARESAPLVVTVDVELSDHIYRASACALVGESDAVSGVVTIFRDITQEVEVARMKDDFVSMVSHELRTPMTSVLGFTRLIQKQFQRHIAPCLDDAEGADRRVLRASDRILSNLEIILSEGDRLTRLINDVLDVAKMEAGRIQWDMGGVDLPQIIESSVVSLRSLARQKRLPLEVCSDDGLPPLYGDHDRLVQVVTNLLSNAIKFTEEGGVEVRYWVLAPGDDIAPYGPRYPQEGLGLPVEAPMVAICVQDTGIGIAEADLPKVFEKFRQVGAQGKSSLHPGTGLGLAISRQIVEHHGGRIWVESRRDEGSRFVFTLPLEAPDGV